MSEEKVFVDGMIVKRHPNAPDFVKASVSFKMDEFLAFARQHHKDKWLNVQIKESRGGKLYAELDTWRPSQQEVHDHGMQQARQVVDDLDGDCPF